MMVISEHELLQMTRGPLRDRLLTGTIKPPLKADQDFQELWSSILQTCYASDISARHRTAACNALSAFCETAAISDVASIKAYGLSPQLWLASLDMYLTKHEVSKPKAMKQVLGTLERLLYKYEPGDASILKKNLLNRVLAVLFTSEPRSQLKACATALEHFIRRDVVNGNDLLDYLYTWLYENNIAWFEIASMYDMEDPPILAADVNRSDTPSSQPSALDIFITRLLFSMSIPEVAPINGKLLSMLCKSFEEGTLHAGHANRDSPWFRPVQQVLEREPSLVEILSHHLFPDLLKLDPRGYQRFVHIMLPATLDDEPRPLTKENVATRVRVGDLSTLNERALQMALSFLLVGKQLGHVLDVGKHRAILIP